LKILQQTLDLEIKWKTIVFGLRRATSKKSNMRRKREKVKVGSVCVFRVKSWVIYYSHSCTVKAKIFKKVLLNISLIKDSDLKGRPFLVLEKTSFRTVGKGKNCYLIWKSLCKCFLLDLETEHKKSIFWIETDNLTLL
jgi:hypothetical protein